MTSIVINKRLKGYEKVKDSFIESNRRRHEKALSAYWENPDICINCGKVMPYTSRQHRKYTKQKYRRLFCSRSCSASYTNKRRQKKVRTCVSCGKTFLRKRAGKFCSLQCHSDYRKKKYIEDWLNGIESGRSGKYGMSKYIRDYLMYKANNKCELCGWGEINRYSGKNTITVEHKDGNFANNCPENLIILCPNCHSLTPTYGALNKGRGRKSRTRADMAQG